MSPADLLRAVVALLERQGHRPVLRTGDLPQAVDAAHTLLRCFGVEPPSRPRSVGIWPVCVCGRPACTWRQR